MINGCVEDEIGGGKMKQKKKKMLSQEKLFSLTLSFSLSLTFFSLEKKVDVVEKKCC